MITTPSDIPDHRRTTLKTKTLATIAAAATFAIGAHLGARTAQAAPPPPTYVVEIKTGCLSKSGTDANVQISLLGSGYSFGKFLDNPGVNDFENGRTDSYRFVGWDLGDVSQIHLGHDNTGGSPG